MTDMSCKGDSNGPDAKCLADQVLFVSLCAFELEDLGLGSGRPRGSDWFLRLKLLSDKYIEMSLTDVESDEGSQDMVKMSTKQSSEISKASEYLDLKVEDNITVKRIWDMVRDSRKTQDKAIEKKGKSHDWVVNAIFNLERGAIVESGSHEKACDVRKKFWLPDKITEEDEPVRKGPGG